MLLITDQVNINIMNVMFHPSSFSHVECRHTEVAARRVHNGDRLRVITA